MNKWLFVDPNQTAFLADFKFILKTYSRGPNLATIHQDKMKQLLYGDSFTYIVGMPIRQIFESKGSYWLLICVPFQIVENV